MSIELINGDCLEKMAAIPDGSIDLVLTDPPYQKTQNQWDSLIDFVEMWKHIKRVSKENAAIVLFGQGIFTSKLILSNPEMFRYSLIWEKTKAGGFLNARRMPLQSHEDIVVFYRKLPKYNPQMESGKPYIKKAVTNGDGKNYGKFNREGIVVVNKGERFPRSVLKFSNDNHNSLHPTQKPLDLIEYLIRTYSNDGDTVLDFTMGSGTTGLAAKNTNRSFIGIELDPAYFEIAKKRIL